MDSQKPTLTVIRAPAAIDELDMIWRWNAEHYGVDHADQYLAFLKQAIDGLAENYHYGKTVSARPELRYILMRRRTSGHGHVAVYSFDDKEIHVLHVFHTAQDWQDVTTKEVP